MKFLNLKALFVLALFSQANQLFSAAEFEAESPKAITAESPEPSGYLSAPEAFVPALRLPKSRGHVLRERHAARYAAKKSAMPQLGEAHSFFRAQQTATIEQIAPRVENAQRKLEQLLRNIEVDAAELNERIIAGPPVQDESELPVDQRADLERVQARVRKLQEQERGLGDLIKAAKKFQLLQKKLGTQALSPQLKPRELKVQQQLRAESNTRKMIRQLVGTKDSGAEGNYEAMREELAAQALAARVFHDGKPSFELTPKGIELLNKMINSPAQEEKN